MSGGKALKSFPCTHYFFMFICFGLFFISDFGFILSVILLHFHSCFQHVLPIHLSFISNVSLCVFFLSNLNETVWSCCHLLSASLCLSADVNECEVYKADSSGLLCAHVCVNIPGSYHCSCPSGYKLLADGRSCEGKGRQCGQHCTCLDLRNWIKTKESGGINYLWISAFYYCNHN